MVGVVSGLVIVVMHSGWWRLPAAIRGYRQLFVETSAR